MRSALRPTTAASPRLSSETSVAWLKARQARRAAVELRRRGAQVDEQRRLLGREVAELDEGRAQLGEEVVEQVEVGGEVLAPLGRRGRGVARLLDELDDVLAALGEAADDAVGVRVEVADDPVLAREDVERLAAADAAPERRGGSRR